MRFRRRRLTRLRVWWRRDYIVCSLENDRSSRLKFQELSLSKFLVYVATKYLQITRKTLMILLPFSTSYICERGFSALRNMKGKHRAQLQFIESEVRVCRTYPFPRTKLLPIWKTCYANSTLVTVGICTTKKWLSTTRYTFQVRIPVLAKFSFSTYTHVPILFIIVKLCSIGARKKTKVTRPPIKIR